jgi:hypothetical protein
MQIHGKFSRSSKLVALVVAICMISFLFVSCGDNDGNTSGNAPNGVISKDDKSEGGVISGIVSAGGEVVSKVEDAVSEIISDIMPDHSSHKSEGSDGSDNSANSANSEEPSDVSFVSEGEVSKL